MKLTVPPNCTVVPANGGPLWVNAASGATTRVAFSVTCAAPGRLRVTVATTTDGPNGSATYMLGVDPGRDMPFRYAVTVSSNGTTDSIRCPWVLTWRPW